MTGDRSRALPDPVAEPTIKADRAAAILKMSRTAIYSAMERGTIPSLRIDRSVRIPTRLFLAKFFPDALPDPSTESVNPTNSVPLSRENGADSHGMSRLETSGSSPAEAA